MKVRLVTYPHHIPDAVVRKLLPQEGFRFGSYIPDGVALVGNTYVVFEYENSSRGLLSAVAKYQHFCTLHKNVRMHVVLIQSLFHQYKHSQDLVLATHVSEHTCRNLSFEFTTCNGYEARIKSLVARTLRRL